MFTNPCYISNPIRGFKWIMKELCEIGYRVVEDICNDYPYLQTTIDGTLYFTETPKGIECSTEDMFLAIARLRNDTDENQYYLVDEYHYYDDGDDVWKIHPGEMILRNRTNCDIYWNCYIDGKLHFMHKASFKELCEYYVLKSHTVIYDGDVFSIIQSDGTPYAKDVIVSIYKNNDELKSKCCDFKDKKEVTLKMLCDMYCDDRYYDHKKGIKQLLNEYLDK